MNAASTRLYTATNQRAAFGDVTLVLPDSWPDSCAGRDRPEVTPTESYLSSDLRVSLAHPVHRTEPWTHQTGLCGQPGAFVQLADKYIIDERGGPRRQRSVFLNEHFVVFAFCRRLYAKDISVNSPLVLHLTTFQSNRNVYFALHLNRAQC